MSWPEAMAIALLAALGRPRWWTLALAAFLVRGGWLVLLLPIVSLPTPAGVANLVAPTLVGFVFGGASASFVQLVAIALLAFLAWLVAGGLLGAWLDLVLVREVAGDDELDVALPARRRLEPDALALRLFAHVPTAALVVWAAARAVPATYAELVSPGDPAIPILLRVLGRMPEAAFLLVAGWAVGEAVGGLAVRRLANGAGLRAAIADAWLDLLRRPTTLATFIVTNVGLGAVIVLGAAVATVAWTGLRIVIVDGGTAAEVRLALIVFSAAWLAGAWLLAIATAWRQVAYTFESLRSRRS